MGQLCQLISPLEDDLLFARMRVTEGLSRLFEIALVAHSRRSDLTGSMLLGQSITVRVTFDDQTERFFNGFVTRMVQGAQEGRFFSYHLTLNPWLWFLTRTSDCRIFQDQKVPDIIKSVFELEPNAAVDEQGSSLGSGYQPWKYCVQYRETDFNFVSRVMEQEGIYYHFAHSENDHKLVLVDAKGAHQPVPGTSTLDYVPGRASGSVGAEWITSWSASEQIEPGRYVLNEYSYENPNLKMLVARAPEHPPQNKRGASEVYDYPGDYDTVGEGEQYVAHRIEELATQTLQFSGSGSMRTFAPGRTFTLAKHPRQDQNGEYLITATEYEFVDAARESGVGVGASFSCSFSAIRAEQQFRPPRITPRPIVQGLQTAVVTGPSGEEIHTDEFGRIKVRFHWDRQGRNDDTSSCWMRVATLAAGGRWGFIAIPRVGHEVLVSFLEGDPDRPVVTGSVYNGLNFPPWTLPDHKNISGYLTRSTRDAASDESNELRFDDTKGSELLRLHAQRDYVMRTEHDLTEWIGNNVARTVIVNQVERIEGNRHLQVVGEQRVQIDQDASLTVKGDDSRDITGGLSIKTGQDVQVKAGGKFATDATGEIHLKAGSTVTIEAASQLSLKVGGNFITINSGGVFINGSMVMINSGGAPGTGSGASPKAPAAPERPNEPPTQETSTTEPLEPKSYSPRAVALKSAAATGAPFCEVCDC